MDTLIPDPFFIAVKTLSGSLRRFIPLKNKEIYVDFEMGKISEQHYLENCFKEGALEKAGFTAIDFKREILKTTAMFSHSELLLKKFHNHHDLFIASNYSIWIHHHLKKLDIEKYFKDIIASYQLGERKPSPRFFEKMIKRIEYRPEDVIFIDDRPENVEAARDYGMVAVLVADDWHLLVDKLLEE